MGYVLKPGFMLPPLMFSEEEIEALVLGSRWVADRGDPELAEAALNVLAKVGAVLPADLRNELEGSTLLIGPPTPPSVGDTELPKIRRAIRAQRKLEIRYRDLKGEETAPHRLALRARLLRARARAGGMVRAARRAAPLPYGPDRRAHGFEDAVPASAPGAAQGMARQPAHRGALKTTATF